MKFNAQIRVYRGKKSGVYTEYCDLSSFSTNLVDCGNHLNGNKWVAFSGGSIPTFNSFSELFYQNGCVELLANSLPTTGTWKKFDKITNLNMWGGQAVGWMYTGSEWKTLGTYA